MMTNTLPQKLFRNTEPKYAKSFVEEGEIMFRSLTYYRTTEDEARRDETDGIFVKNGPVKSVKITFLDLPPHHEMAGVPIEHKVVGDVKLSVSTPSSEFELISCFSKDQIDNFGAGKIEIFDTCGFINCVSAALLNDRLELKYGPVSYYDFDSHLPTQNDLWRQKANSFSSENEFRLGFSLPESRIICQAKYQENHVVDEISVTLVCGPLNRFAKWQ